MADEILVSPEHVVHLARLALTGRSQDVEVYVRRLARTYRDRNPGLSSDLVEMLRRAPTRSSPLRERGVNTATPVDLDSRSPLVRQEWPVVVPVEPVFNTSVSAALAQVVEERKQADRLLDAGLNPTRTALFTGPPGVGKTLAARWIARELDLPFLVLDLSTVISSFLGKTGNNLRRVLDYAKGSPCVLLLDELDAIAKRRDDQIEVGELKRLVTVLLQEIDDWPATSVLLAATNHSELLDPAVWRRFEALIEFSIPGLDLLEKSISKLLQDENVDEDLITSLATVLQGHSFSDVERDIVSIRRTSLVKNTDIGTALVELISRNAQYRDFETRKIIARSLVFEGKLSQRKASELLHVSRDVIRESIKEMKTSEDMAVRSSIARVI
ncbi:AAA family ATPase [Amycolatopsis sp. RM579]|uniref:AAA family ATPase n=1 Tax=Amycolatopsis pithecellobii TaxID=664692 RepID=A0A6N7ZAP9_9PSEU|nr:AAA family ATPase [Amycolatopsis pithecellobii]